MTARLVFGRVLLLSPIPCFFLHQFLTFPLSTSIKLDKVIASLDHDDDDGAICFDNDDDVAENALFMFLQRLIEGQPE